EPWSDQVAVSVVAWGCVSHYLGMLAGAFGDLAAAERHLDHALQVHEQMTAPVWSLQTRLEIGRMLAARGRPGDDTEAIETVRDVLESAGELGSTRISTD